MNRIGEAINGCSKFELKRDLVRSTQANADHVKLCTSLKCWGAQILLACLAVWAGQLAACRARA